MQQHVQSKPVRIPDLRERKLSKDKIVQLAVTNYRDAAIADRLGIDIITASDVAGSTIFGRSDIRTVTLDEMCLIGRAVVRGCRHALKIITMPYWTFQVSDQQAVENAGRLMQATGADGVELEANVSHASAVASIVRAGIPVQAHIGLSGQRLAQLGGFRGIGKVADEAVDCVEDGQALVDAGAFSLICELVASEVTEYLSQTVDVPVISIGSGAQADGASIVAEDLFGLYEEHIPRHARVYDYLIPRIEKGVGGYITDVRSSAYPGEEHSIRMRSGELREFHAAMGKRKGARKVRIARQVG